MSELKTLRDIDDQVVVFGNVFRCVPTKEVREEAIKWVDPDDMCCTCEEKWKDFFNITDEDLQ